MTRKKIKAKSAVKSKSKPTAERETKTKRSITPRDYVFILSQTHTQAEIAKITGKSARTIRRIKADPNYNAKPDTIKAVKKAGTRERNKLRTVDVKKSIRQANETIKKERYNSELPKKPRGKSTYRAPDVPVVPPSQRLTRLDPSDPKLKRRMWSDVISFDVEKLAIDHIIDLLIYYRDRLTYSVNIIYRVPRGKSSLGGQRYNKVGHSGTGWIAIGGVRGRSRGRWSDKQIAEQLAKILMLRGTSDQRAHNILHIQIQPRAD
jgi:hypothetical protein